MIDRANAYPTSPSPELAILQSRIEKTGRLQFATTDRIPSYGGPVMLVFDQHVIDTVIAPPGTSLGEETDDMSNDSWRIRRPRNSTEHGDATSTVSLPEIVDALPGEIAHWAIDTQVEQIVERDQSIGTVKGDNSASIVSAMVDELAEAQRINRLLPRLPKDKLRQKLGELSGAHVTLKTRNGLPATGILSKDPFTESIVIMSSNQDPSLGTVTRTTIPAISVADIAPITS